MSSFPHSLRVIAIAVAFLSIPTVVLAQISLRALPDTPAETRLLSVNDWVKQVVDKPNAIWTESNAATRLRLLQAWAEQTPEQLAYVSRIMQKKEKEQASQLVVALKDLFGLMKRVTWQSTDHPFLQRVVAGWSVVAPQLIKQIDSADLSAAQRRQLEQALVDLAWMSRDPSIGSPVARSNWSGQVMALGQLARHSRMSVRIVSLNVLEALGSDASPARKMVLHSLRDTDHFVRWYAVRTLQSMGMDSESIQAVANMKNDDDTGVRQLVARVIAEPQKQQLTNAPLAKMETLNAVPQPVNVSLPPVKHDSPVKISTMPDIRVEPQPGESLKPAEIPSTLPSKPLQSPAVTTPQVADPVPLFGPPPTARAIQDSFGARSLVQQTSSVTPRRPVNHASQWLPQLKSGSVDKQLQAVRELARLGEGAGEAVPLLAELLLKSDVAVRREVPLALMKIGKPARLAVSMLERSLQDADTDVKVNAARALLELTD